MNTLIVLLNGAKKLGIREDDLRNAKDLLDHHEFGLCFDTIITQMYEYKIEIDSEFYTLIDKIGNRLNLPPENYSFMQELIGDGT